MTTCAKIMPIKKAKQPQGPLVCTLVYDGLCTFEFGVAFEVFGLPRPEMGNDWYRFMSCAVEPGPIRAAGGLDIAAAQCPEVLEQADIIVIPGWRGIDEAVPPGIVSLLQSARDRGARIMSLCSGIVVLAEAGFLANKSATTHWKYFDQVSARFPDILLNKDVLYVDEGDILTAAGSAAAIDLCLHVVRSDFGQQAANSVAKRLVVPPHREGGQAQFVNSPMPAQRQGNRISIMLDWMRQRLDEDLTIQTLAREAGMSVRTFQRHFEQTTGLAPGEWLLRARLKHAQALLESAQDASLTDIAIASGFHSLSSMRHHFQCKLRTSPSVYRKSFRCTI